MRPVALGLFAALAFAPVAHAEPAQEARSATGACLAAIFDGAPVGDIERDDVEIKRGRDPVSCTVRVTAGMPVVIRDAVQQAIAKRTEGMLAAKSKWDPQGFASRETWCNLPGRRNIMATVSTGKPGARLVLVATVLEAKTRDPRCDRDLGVQKVAVDQPEPAAEVAKPPASKEEKRRKGWLRLPW